MPAILMNSPTTTEPGGNGRTGINLRGGRPCSSLRTFSSTRSPRIPRRLLFLDDDPRRAETFLHENPEAVWVTTVAECLQRMNEAWDEVHLDHDLGGQHFVDMNQVDCGMEIIRWMCKEPRPHLNHTLFFVHTHNSVAGLLMVLQMRTSGYKAEFRPFGFDIAKLLAHNEPAGDADPGASRSFATKPASLAQVAIRVGNLASSKENRSTHASGPGNARRLADELRAACSTGLHRGVRLPRR